MSADGVLVIDDDEVARLVIAKVLVRAGFRTHTLASPIGATRAIREHDVRAVICDLNMPAMRGDALARALRQSTVLRSVRWLLVTGAARDELDRALLDGAADAVVHKADVETKLVARLEAVLGRR